MKAVKQVLRLSAVVAVLTVQSFDAHAQCALQGCGTAICGGGCPTSIPVKHSSLGQSGDRGAFGFQGTHFENTCAGNGPAGPCGVIEVPPVRFWAFNHYALANSGCVDAVSNRWLMHGTLDLGQVDTPGNWYLYASDWTGIGGAPAMGNVDGCIQSTPPVLPDLVTRTVAEVSFADAQSGEGSVDHDGWYAISSVPDSGGTFDFDQIKGANSGGPFGDGPAHVVVRSIPDVEIKPPVGASMVCPDNGTPVEAPVNAVDPSYVDVEVRVLPAVPTSQSDWFTEQGRNKDPQLIEGTQIVYTIGATPPLSSSSGWVPARDPADPQANVAAVIPWGSDLGQVSVPIGGGQQIWFAGRLVYRDASVNGQTGPGPEASAPKLFSVTGRMCGPVVGPVAIAVDFGAIRAQREPGGRVRIVWNTLREDDTIGFTVMRATSASGSENREQVVGGVTPLGPHRDYEVIDFDVRPGERYWYYVEEITSAGAGSRSPIVALDEARAADGGRARGRGSSPARRR